MNLKFHLALLAGLLMPPVADACDVCGCSAGNQNLGVLPDARYHFIGIQYQYSSFSSDHASLFDRTIREKSTDNYQNIQLWGRYNPGKRLQLFAFLPYRFNQQRQDSITTSRQGIGDISVLANRVLLNRTRAGRQQILLAGGGLKAPTGAYTGVTASDKQGLPNMQPGSGSWDFIVNANYTLRFKQTGLNADASYTFTLPNASNYKYGNRLNSGLTAFHSWQQGDFSILPQAGIRFEYALHDYDNYDRKWLNEQSGGYLCFATAGGQLYYRNTGFRFSYYLPVSQHYGAGDVSARQRLEAGLLILL